MNGGEMPVWLSLSPEDQLAVRLILILLILGVIGLAWSWYFRMR